MAKTITQIKKEVKESERKKDFEIIECCPYESCGGLAMRISIYDKKTKRVFGGYIGLSGYTKEEVLKRLKDSSK